MKPSASSSVLRLVDADVARTPSVLPESDTASDAAPGPVNWQLAGAGMPNEQKQRPVQPSPVSSQSRHPVRHGPSRSHALEMDPTDARWVVAVRTAVLLDGGSAALLTPARRRAIMSLAKDLGLRAFDASLVVAVVQDAARRGEPPLGTAVQSRLRVVGPGQTQKTAASARRCRANLAGRLFGAALLGAVMLAWLIHWVAP